MRTPLTPGAARPMSGLGMFGSRLDPRVVDEIESWENEAELGRILAKLHANTQPRAFFNTYAEALVARHLVHGGCTLRFEVPTPAGRQCDFHVRRGELEFFLHVKHLSTEHLPMRMLSVSARLRYLERIERPYIVSVQWRDRLSDEQMQMFVHDAGEFIGRGHVGDEHVVRDERGGRLGYCRIVAPWDGRHVSLTFSLPQGLGNPSIRMRRLLERAYQQFMPRSLNVILLASSNEEDETDFEDALLGTQIERWDVQPPRGRRIAHGRDDDGFWHGRHFEESSVAGWFRFRPDVARISPKLRWRSDAEVPRAQQRLLNDVLAGPEVHG
jgi:hypothetical protein